MIPSYLGKKKNTQCGSFIPGSRKQCGSYISRSVFSKILTIVTLISSHQRKLCDAFSKHFGEMYPSSGWYHMSESHISWATQLFVQWFMQSVNNENYQRSALLAICAEKPLVTGGFPSQRATLLATGGFLTQRPSNAESVSGRKIHAASMGPTWVLSAPGGPHVGPMNLAIRGGHVMMSSHNVTALNCSISPPSTSILLSKVMTSPAVW